MCLALTKNKKKCKLQSIPSNGKYCHIHSKMSFRKSPVKRKSPGKRKSPVKRKSPIKVNFNFVSKNILIYDEDG